MSQLSSPLCTNFGRTSLVVADSGDGEGMKTGWVILVLKSRTLVPCIKLGLVAGVVLGSESKLVVRSNDSMGVYVLPLKIFSF